MTSVVLELACVTLSTGHCWRSAPYRATKSPCSIRVEAANFVIPMGPFLWRRSAARDVLGMLGMALARRCRQADREMLARIVAGDRAIEGLRVRQVVNYWYVPSRIMRYMVYRG